ncbi:sensor histidine kinase [Solitalea canadensis]|uniref:histidine kinase n=1 Tax=Solitalea canadensis (strain ATCC 29591 / DSM 3403 / JCM 21819 / LMG 8368 / NBRC 15130 / NCIMB 12057 / USAM 9D) TaxID=929556 RepID=H8KM25_SOLCM|nr:HAMP domain-containing sensor histidine kinase [Solitalea canadensis]AFD08947.1 signal transduction histidine kinase [Solitalea canadensis DSM 3403]
MLTFAILCNYVSIRTYYQCIYPLQFERTVKAINEHIVAYHELPEIENVHYKKLDYGTIPKTYGVETFSFDKNELAVLSYYSSVTLHDQLYEVKINRYYKSNDGPGTGVIIFALLISAGLFFFLNWLFFRLSIKRLTFNMWKPYYSNLRRVNAYNVGSNRPLQLVNTDIREFNLFNEAILRFTGNAQKSYEQLREFVENTSHELQTPLAILLTKVELILKHKDLGSAEAKELIEVKQIIQRLSGVHKGLSLLSRIKSIQCCSYYDKENVNINDAIKDSFEIYEELIAFKEISVTIEESLQLTLSTNIELIKILVDNLIRNSIQHNYHEGVIAVQVSEEGFKICNTGVEAPMPGKDMFSRYHTSSKDSGRLGIGLAIVEAICETLHFTCEYSSQTNLHSFTIKIN